MEQNTLLILCIGAVIIVFLIVLVVKQVNAGKKSGLREVRIQVDRLQAGMDILNENLNKTQSDQRMELVQQFRNLSEMMMDIQKNISNTNVEGYERLRLSVERRLDEMQKTVDEKLTESLNTGLENSFTRVSEQLSQLYKSIGEVKTLSSGVTDLKNILSNVKKRGTWGEVQLERLLGDFLAPGQYEKNAHINGDVVEFAVLLPGDSGRVFLPVDSKFPMDRFAHVQESEGESRKTALQELARAISDEARKINTKYICPPLTTDFAVMFLPSESLYLEVLGLNILEAIQNKYRILIAGPSTLSALLTSLHTGFRTLAIKEHSVAILDMLNVVRNEFEHFEEYIDKTRHSLSVAQGHLDSVSKRSMRIHSKLNEAENYRELP